MKLEVENASSDFSEQDQSSEYLSDEQISALLDQGIQAAERGSRRRARKLFQQIVQADSENENAWFWLASIGEYPEEVLASLRRVLEINPQNERAIEMSAIARSLLADTFFHHGNRALEKNCRELANECFFRAVSYDSQNENSWLQISFLAQTQEERNSYLQKVLDINPANETALSAMESIKRETIDSLMKKANSAAIAGEREIALELLEEVSQTSPDLEEAWILKAYLAESFHEKISCYEKVLQLNPDNEAAQAGLFSLRALIQKTESQKPLAEAIEEAFENNNLSRSEDLPDNFSNFEDATIQDSEKSFSEEIDFAQDDSEEIETNESENDDADNAYGFEYSDDAQSVGAVIAAEHHDIVAYAESDLLNLQEPEASFSESLDEDSDETLNFELAVESQFQETPEDLNDDFQASEISEPIFDETQQIIFEERTDAEPLSENHSSDSEAAATFFAADNLNVENEEVLEDFSAEISLDEVVSPENKVSTVMIVDDNPTILKLVSGKLEKSGYHVVPATNGEEALSKMINVRPDLILLDITMPKMNGYQVCKIIRSQEKTRNVPVLMISSRDGVFDETRGKMVGSTGFISKPFGPESLMRTIENYLR